MPNATESNRAEGNLELDESAMRESYVIFLTAGGKDHLQVDYSSAQRFASDVTGGGEKRAFGMTQAQIILALDSGG